MIYNVKNNVKKAVHVLNSIAESNPNLQVTIQLEYDDVKITGETYDTSLIDNDIIISNEDLGKFRDAGCKYVCSSIFTVANIVNRNLKKNTCNDIKLKIDGRPIIYLDNLSSIIVNNGRVILSNITHESLNVKERLIKALQSNIITNPTKLIFMNLEMLDEEAKSIKTSTVSLRNISIDFDNEEINLSDNYENNISIIQAQLYYSLNQYKVNDFKGFEEATIMLTYHDANNHIVVSSPLVDFDNENNIITLYGKRLDI
jgi:hypothetical protein